MSESIDQWANKYNFSILGCLRWSHRVMGYQGRESWNVGQDFDIN